MESPVQSSEITGEGEGCSSIESGWTMYLNSPMNESDEALGHGYEGDEGDGEVYSNGDGFHDSNSDPNREGEDDSLASDASTGNLEKKARTMLDNHGDNYDYYDGGYGENSYKSTSNVKKDVVKKEKKEKKEKKGCFMSLFKGGDSSKGSSSKNWRTNFNGK